MDVDGVDRWCLRDRMGGGRGGVCVIAETRSAQSASRDGTAQDIESDCPSLDAASGTRTTQKASVVMTLSWMKDDHIVHWTPQRAQQAEREMLIAEGRVIEPNYLWSAVAQQHEAAAAVNRERASRGIDEV